MGLDMYLELRKNYSGYDFSGDTATYKNIIEAAGMAEAATSESPYVTVTATVIYWRKANAIHRWFVDTLADGEDLCQEIYVPVEKLKQLRELCFEALSIPGSTNYDEWYVQDLQHTMDSIDRVLATLPDDGEGWDWSLVYRASW